MSERESNPEEGRFDYLKERTPNIDIGGVDVGFNLYTGTPVRTPADPHPAAAPNDPGNLLYDLGNLPTVHPLGYIIEGGQVFRNAVTGGRRGKTVTEVWGSPGGGGGGRRGRRGLEDPGGLFGTGAEGEVRQARTNKKKQQQQQNRQQSASRDNEEKAQQQKQQEARAAEEKRQEQAAQQKAEQKKAAEKKRKKSKGKKGMPYGMGPGETSRSGGPGPSYDDIFGTDTDPHTMPTGRGGRSGGRGRPTGDSFRPGTDPHTLPPQHSDRGDGPGRPTRDAPPGGSVTPATNIFTGGPTGVEQEALRAKLEGPSRLSNPEFEEGDEARSDRTAVTKGEMPFYRGGESALRRMAPAYFTSRESMAKFYGPVTEYRLKLRNPKFVTKTEWMGFDATSLSLYDSSPVEDLIAGGYDSAVWVTKTPRGEKMFTVFALNGKAISTPSRLSNPRRRKIDLGEW